MSEFICRKKKKLMLFWNIGEASATYHFKILIPSVAAGAIIGKGGETIASLQKETSARVKMSKSHDFYPGLFLIKLIRSNLIKSNAFVFTTHIVMK